MSTPQPGGPVGLAPRGDDGFGLVEVLVSMVLFTIVMLALVPAQVRSFQTVGLARERQTATGYATQALEQVQAATRVPTVNADGTRTYDRQRQIFRGRADVTGDPYVTADCAAARTCTFTPTFDADFARTVSGEVLDKAGDDPALSTQRCSVASGRCVTDATPVSGLVFTTRLYVTQPAASSTLVNLTAITTWSSSSNRAAQPQNVAVRTQLVSS